MGARTAVRGYGHRIQFIGWGVYRLWWSFDTKIGGSRLRWPRTRSRGTDREGAERFSKKWGCAMPKAVSGEQATDADAGGTHAETP